MQDRGPDPLNNLLYLTRNHALDVDGRVEVEMACRSCGYILLGLHERDRCPECGSPVAVSLDGELLRTCRPDWLASIATAVRFNAWSMFALIGVITLMIFTRFRVGWIVALYAALALWALTSWRLGRPEPSQSHHSRHQLTIRAAALAVVACALATLLLMNYALRVGSLRVVLPAIAWLALVIAQSAQLHMLAELAHRIPQSDAGWSAHGRAIVMAWVNGGCGLVLVMEAIGIHLCCFTPIVIAATWWIIVASAMTQMHIADFLKIESVVATEHWDLQERITQLRQGKTP